MIKSIISIQTILICLLPLCVKGFNSSLSFDLLGSAGKVNQELALPEVPYRIKTIVIDAGHGGKDPGCSGSFSREKHIALSVSLQLAQAIRAKFPDIRVILTRDSDEFIPLHERAAIANRANADLFISIHCNYMPGSSATSGTETYVMGLHTAEHNLNVAKRENSAILLEEDYEKNYDYDPSSPEGHIMLSMFQNAYLEQSILLAEKFEDQAAAHAGRRSRGVKQAGFMVLKETTMPSILAEIGFLSNRKEEAFLNTDIGQLEMVNALVLAFAEYKQIIENEAFTVGAGDKMIASLPLDGKKLEASSPVAGEPLIRIDKPEALPANPGAEAAPANPKPTKEQKNTESAAATTEKKIVMHTVFSNETEVTPNNVVLPESSPPPATRGRETLISSEAAPAPSGPAVPVSYSAPPPPPAAPAAKKNLQYCVQLAAAPKPLNIQHPRWAEVGYMVEVIREGEYFKYQARNFSKLEEAQKARMRLHHLGFLDAFIVIYQDNQRLSADETQKIIEAAQ